MAVQFSRPESQLIVALSRQQVTAEAEEISRASLSRATLSGRFDWALFSDQAMQHRVAGLIARNLGELQALGRPLAIDPVVSAALQAMYLFYSERTRILIGELRELLAAAADASIVAIPRKGGHLAQTVYADPGLRPMGDLDLLVASDQAESFSALLARLGYRQGQMQGSRLQALSRRESLFWNLYGSDLPKFVKVISHPYKNSVSIDVNTSLVLPGKGYVIPTKELLERSVSCEVGEHSARFLGLEDVAIDLCAHIYKNSTVLRFMRAGKHRMLIKYVDLAEYLDASRASFSWSVFLERSERYSIRKQVFYSLAHLEGIFPGTVPPDALTEFGSGYEDHGIFLGEYAQWDRPTPLTWEKPFEERFFSRMADAQIPSSRSLV
jgi:Uncharacterised nucleotidyltransferase